MSVCIFPFNKVFIAPKMAFVEINELTRVLNLTKMLWISTKIKSYIITWLIDIH